MTALTNSSAAEYGRSGGAVLNLITKAGTSSQNKQNAVEPTLRHLLLWAKYRF